MKLLNFYGNNVDHVLKMVKMFDHVYRNVNPAFERNVEQVFENVNQVFDFFSQGKLHNQITCNIKHVLPIFPQVE